MTSANKSMMKKVIAWKNSFKDPKVPYLSLNKAWAEVDRFVMDLYFWSPERYLKVKGVSKDEAIERFVRKMKRTYRVTF